MLDVRRIKSIWRVFVLTLVIQFLGSLISYSISPFHDQFINFWIGGALATPAGVIAGTFWHYFDGRRRTSSSRPVIIFLTLISFFLGGAMYFRVLPRFVKEKELIKSIKNIRAEEISSIDVFGEDKRKLIRHFDDRNEIRKLTEALTDAEGYSPDHPTYLETWIIQINEGFDMDLVVNYEQRHPGVAIVGFAEKEANSVHYYGTFKSKKLRSWMERNVRGEKGEKKENPVITEHENLSRYEGEKVTIRGEVANTKIPTIIGVDVRSFDPDLRGEVAKATGILQRRTVTKAELQERREERGATAHRGPGTFYRLEVLGSDELAQVQPAEE